MASTELDLKTIGIYEVNPGIVAVGTTEALEIAYAASASSVGSARFLVTYSIPS
jgi:hypothetical protein